MYSRVLLLFNLLLVFSGWAFSQARGSAGIYRTYVIDTVFLKKDNSGEAINCIQPGKGATVFVKVKAIKTRDPAKRVKDPKGLRCECFFETGETESRKRRGTFKWISRRLLHKVCSYNMIYNSDEIIPDDNHVAVRLYYGNNLLGKRSSPQYPLCDNADPKKEDCGLLDTMLEVQQFILTSNAPEIIYDQAYDLTFDMPAGTTDTCSEITIYIYPEDSEGKSLGGADIEQISRNYCKVNILSDRSNRYEKFYRFRITQKARMKEFRFRAEMKYIKNGKLQFIKNSYSRCYKLFEPVGKK